MAELARRLRRVDALAIALGCVIGVGVFRNTGLALSGTGGFAAATLLWLVVGALCLGGAILYADLSSRVPEAGGPYAYVRVAFGGRWAFVYGWLLAGVAIPARSASTASVASEFLAAWIPLPARALAVLLLVALALLHLLGVRAGAYAQHVLTTGKLATIALVIGLSIALGLGGAPPGRGTPAAIPFADALGAVWFTYLGWQDAVLLAEELRAPRRDLPVVLVGTVALTMVLFVALHTVVYWGLGGGAEAYGRLPALTVAQRTLGSLGDVVMRALMLSSMIGVTAVGLLVRPRIAMALARDGLGPAPLARVSRVGTPYAALGLQTGIAVVLAATGRYETLLTLISFATGVLGLFETASYFVVRRKRPALPTSPGHPWAPLAFIVVSAALCAIGGVHRPMGILTSAAILAAIALVYAVARPRAIPAETSPQVAVHAAPVTPHPDAET